MFAMRCTRKLLDRSELLSLHFGYVEYPAEHRGRLFQYRTRSN